MGAHHFHTSAKMDRGIQELFEDLTIQVRTESVQILVVRFRKIQNCKNSKNRYLTVQHYIAITFLHFKLEINLFEVDLNLT